MTLDYRLQPPHEIHFNSHAHVERDCCRKPERDNYSYFNSHAHVERDENPLRGLFILTISTHTLTWSVTASRAPRNRSGDFNSHAHVERDRENLKTLTTYSHFNSHAHVERDILVSCIARCHRAFQLTRSRGA